MPEVPQPDEMHVGLNTINLVHRHSNSVLYNSFLLGLFQGLVYYRHSQLHVREKKKKKKKKRKKKLDGSFSAMRSVSTPDPQRLLSLETPVP